MPAPGTSCPAKIISDKSSTDDLKLAGRRIEVQAVLKLVFRQSPFRKHVHNITGGKLWAGVNTFTNTELTSLQNTSVTSPLWFNQDSEAKQLWIAVVLV